VKAVSAEEAATRRRMQSAILAHGQGITLARFRAQLEDLRDTLLTLELNLSTFGTHSRINLGHTGDKVSLVERKGAK